MNQFYNPVSNFFRAKGLIIPPENQWMQGCIDFCLSENRNANLNEIQAFVYDQWLLADLCDVGVPCLPANLATRHFSVLQGCYPLQVNEVMNVGQSSYSQLQKVRKVATENTEVSDNKPTTQAWEPKGGRMLRLIATDGIQKVFIMEYKPIKTLQEPFVPGFKIIVRGPVECRKGVLLLEEKHLTVFGGEVDDLVIQNSLENLLLKSLNLETVPNPVNQIGAAQTQAAVGDDARSQYYAPTQAPPARSQNAPANSSLPMFGNQPRVPPTIPNNTNSRNNNQTRSRNDAPLTDQISQEFFDGFLDDGDDDLLAMHLDQVAPEENNALNDSQLLASDEDEALLQISDNLLGGHDDQHQATHNYSYLDLPSTSHFYDSNNRDSSNGKTSQFSDRESKTVNDKLAGKNSNQGFKAEPLSNPSNSRNLPDPTVSKTSQFGYKESKSVTSIPDKMKASRSFKEEPLSNSDFRNSRDAPLPSASHKAIKKSSSQIETRPSQTSRLPDLPFLKRSASSPLKERSGKVIKDSLSATAFSRTSESSASRLNLVASFFEWSTDPTRQSFVEAKVVSLASKLKIKDRKWTLSAMISDGMEEIKVDFSSEVLEKLVEHSAAEITAKKDEIEKDPVLKAQIRDVLTKAKARLSTLKAKMKIELPNLLSSPTITEVIEDS